MFYVELVWLGFFTLLFLAPLLGSALVHKKTPIEERSKFSDKAGNVLLLAFFLLSVLLYFAILDFIVE